MRAFEFLDDNGLFRQPRITLRFLNQEKQRAKKQLADRERRQALFPAMYGQGDFHQDTLDKLEREKKAVELAKHNADLEKKKAELAALKAKQEGQLGLAVTRMAKSEIKRRKKRC